MGAQGLRRINNNRFILLLRSHFLFTSQFRKNKDDRLDRGLPDNPHVEPEIAVTHVKGVVLIAMEDAFKIYGRPPEAFHLCKPRDTGLNKIPEFVLRYLVRKANAI